MSIYQVNQDAQLTKLPKAKFTNEAQMKAITEANLMPLLNAYFIADEYELDNRRIDTLAYDDDKQSFIIIEYKNCKNDKAVDQSIAYWNLLQTNHQKLVQLFNLWLEKQNIEPITEAQINWAECRIAVIAPNFNHEQVQAFSYDERINLYTMQPLNKLNLISFKKLPNHKPIRQANLENALIPSPVILPKTMIEKTINQVESETSKSNLNQIVASTHQKNPSTNELVEQMLNYFTLADDRFNIEATKMKFNDHDEIDVDNVYKIRWNQINGGIIRTHNDQIDFYLYEQLANNGNLNISNMEKIEGIYNDKKQTYYHQTITDNLNIQNAMISLKFAVAYYRNNHEKSI